MKNQTIAQQLNIKTFPFEIKNNKGNQIYYEDSTGHWVKWEYNEKGNEIYYENSNGFWVKREYDDKGNPIYSENSNGYWVKREYDDNGNKIYHENSDVTIIDDRPKPSVELTLDEIASKFNIDVSQLKIKKSK